jgi:hypothetical protein
MDRATVERMLHRIKGAFYPADPNVSGIKSKVITDDPSFPPTKYVFKFFHLKSQISLTSKASTQSVAMAGVALNFIGALGSGLIGAIPLIKGNVHPPPDQTTTVQIQLGQNATQGASLGGNLPGVSLWDEQGEAIGSSIGGEQLPQGNFKNVQIVAHPNVGNVPAAYVSISASGDDAVCVAFVTIIQANGDSSSFTGDVAAQCGATWFESSINLGTDGEHPRCVWIDKNGSDGLQDQGFGFHVRDFFGTDAQGIAYGANNDLMCKSGPRFRMYQQLKAKDQSSSTTHHSNTTRTAPTRIHPRSSTIQAP